MIVMKFGGTSIKTVDDIHRIISIIRRHRDETPVVVISAFARVTNNLEKIAYLAGQKKTNDAHTTSRELFHKHEQIAGTLLSKERKKIFTSEAENYSYQLNQLIDGLSLVGEITPRTIDQFSSYGERLSSLLFTLILQEQEIPAELIGVERYLYTSNDFSRAVPIFEEVEENIQSTFQPVLSKGFIPVTPGFIGVTKRGIWTTMGRESSDYTATLIGAYLQAKEVQLWKEVEGIRSADPDILSDTIPVERLSYSEALELANLGAKVLHPRTIIPVINQGIPIRVLSSRLQSTGQTFITADAVATGVKSVTYKKDIALIRISAPYQANGDIHLSNINQYIRSLPFDMHLTLQVGSETVVLIDAKYITEDILSSLKRYGEIDYISDAALVGIVGESIGSTPDYGVQFAEALKGISKGVLLSGASSRSVCAVVPDSESLKLVGKLHERYFFSHQTTH